MKRKLPFFPLLLMVLLLPLQSCALNYSAAPIEAWVVDAESGKPLEGVIVTANWRLMGGLEGGNELGQMMVMETITDKSGRFYFPAWGPKRNVSDGHIKSDGPQLLLFKSGYRYVVLSNKTSVTDRPGPSLKSDWNGKTIEMKLFKGPLIEYEKHLGSLRTNLGFAYYGESCEWRQAPRMIAAQHKENLRFKAAGIIDPAGDSVLTISAVRNQKQCGQAQEFFREYIK